MSGDFATGLATTYPDPKLYITTNGGDDWNPVTASNVNGQNWFAVSANSDGSKLVAVALFGWVSVVQHR